MKRRKLHVVWLWGLLFLMTACGVKKYAVHVKQDGFQFLFHTLYVAESF